MCDDMDMNNEEHSGTKPMEIEAPNFGKKIKGGRRRRRRRRRRRNRVLAC